MLEIIKLGGWMMAPIIACSVVAMAIIGERLWALRTSRITPAELIPQVWDLHRNQKLDAVALRNLKTCSPLGTIVASSISSQKDGR